MRWNRNEILSKIVGRYVNKCHRLGIDTVVFDKYKLSIKDVIRDFTLYRSAPLVVDICMNKFSSDSSEFLNNIFNKTSLILFLGNTMKYEGIKIIFCDNYIDAATAK